MYFISVIRSFCPASLNEMWAHLVLIDRFSFMLGNSCAEVRTTLHPKVAWKILLLLIRPPVVALVLNVFIPLFEISGVNIKSVYSILQSYKYKLGCLCATVLNNECLFLRSLFSLFITLGTTVQYLTKYTQQYNTLFKFQSDFKITVVVLRNELRTYTSGIAN